MRRKKSIKFVLTLLTAFVLMLVFRTLAFTLYTVDGQGLTPLFVSGDRVLVNRWSYGLRIGGNNSLFGYSRICRQQVKKGDIVAFEDPRDKDHSQILICRCKGVPGDTVNHNGKTILIPGVKDCADTDYYWMEAIGPSNAVDSRQLGLVSEKLIIGRVCRIVYSHNPAQSLFKGWRNRWMIHL